MLNFEFENGHEVVREVVYETVGGFLGGFHEGGSYETLIGGSIGVLIFRSSIRCVGDIK